MTSCGVRMLKVLLWLCLMPGAQFVTTWHHSSVLYLHVLLTFMNGLNVVSFVVMLLV